MQDALPRAAAAIRDAEALLVGAGAGMGVDSGLPDFRGNEGFWRAYPPFRGRSLAEISNPVWFHLDPERAWGFFGHRLGLYRDTVPHGGFAILRRWGERLRHGLFVFTSNVDGQFEKAGFDPNRVIECHGSLQFLQCVHPCSHDIWPAEHVSVDVDVAHMRARSALPRCPRCDAVARPNTLMFGDADWLPGRYRVQADRYAAWCDRVANARVVAVEIGAGLAIPTVRRECEAAADVLIRINPRDPQVPPGGIALAGGGLATLRAIDEILKSGGTA